MLRQTFASALLIASLSTAAPAQQPPSEHPAPQIQIDVKFVEFSRERLLKAGVELPTLEGAHDANSPSDERRIIVRDPAPVLKAINELRKKGLVRILGEPKMLVTNGRPAKMLAGGEFAVPAPDGTGEKVHWREFGVRMQAVATVLCDRRLRLAVQPEISEPDFTNGIRVAGHDLGKVPAITTRRVNVEFEMNAGEMLVLSGLPSGNPIEEVGGRGSREHREMWVLVTAEFVTGLDPDQLP